MKAVAKHAGRLPTPGVAREFWSSILGRQAARRCWAWRLYISYTLPFFRHIFLDKKRAQMLTRARERAPHGHAQPRRARCRTNNARAADYPSTVQNLRFEQLTAGVHAHKELLHARDFRARVR